MDGSVHLSDDTPDDIGEGLVKPAATKPKKGRRTSVEAMPDVDDDDVDGVMPATAASEPSNAASNAAVAVLPTSSKSDFALEDLEHIGTLGVGTFSRVKMVKIKVSKALSFCLSAVLPLQCLTLPSACLPACLPACLSVKGTMETYALKIMKKKVIEIRKQKEHVMNEKHIMTEMNGNPFLLTLKTTFKDEVYLYMLLEICQGGELFSRLLEETTLSEDTTRFYCGCIVLALEALHGKDNIYRDLKPENILLDATGYVKIGES
eukprot:SAG22_NODE_1248_length_5014_cov_9.812004_5_plen_263_part_00